MTKHKVRAIMIHETREPQYALSDRSFGSKEDAIGWKGIDLFAEACSLATQNEPELDGYWLDDIDVMEVDN